MDRNRRAVLSLLAGTATGGCLGAGPGTGTPSTETTGTDDPSELGVEDPAGCPSFGSNVERVVCAPDAPEGTPMALAPAEQSGALPRTELSFSLTNGTDSRLTTNFYAWKIWKRVDGEWFHVAPRAWPVPAMTLEPGDSHAWTVTVDNADLDRRLPRAEGTDRVTVAGLGAGTYAFGVAGAFESETYESKTGFAARFELTGDPLDLTPVGVESVERNGEAVVVRIDREEDGPLSRYRVVRVESPDGEPRRRIAEQVIRNAPLRNALAQFEAGVERVDLLADDGTIPPFGVREPRLLSYEGEAFRIETERVESTTEG